MTPSAWTPVDETASGWKPVQEAKPAPYNPAQRGAKAKGNPAGFDDSFMGTISKDLAALPEGAYNAVTHPVDTLKGAFRQLLNLPGDVVTDISQGNWGKLAAKATELAVPALSTERGAAVAASAGEKAAAGVKAAVSIPAKAGSAVLDAATAPGTRDVIGMFSPRAGKALDLAAKIRGAVEKAKAEGAPAAAEAGTPGQAYAQANKIDWATLSKEDQAMLENVAKAQQNAASQPQRTPPPPRQEVIQPTEPAAEAGAPGKTIEQMLAEEMAAQRASAAPAAAPAAPPAPVIGARTPQPLPSRGAPLRPPLATETRAQYEAAMQAPQAAAAPAVEPPAAPAPKPPSVAQQDAWVSAKTKPDIGVTEQAAEGARTRYDANGEAKSPQLRGAEKTAVNRVNKAQRFAQALHDSGISSKDAATIQAGRLGDTAIRGGAAPGWGNIADSLGENNPSDMTVPQIIAELRKLEGGAPKAATAPKGPMDNPKARAIAEQLKAEMEKQ